MSETSAGSLDFPLTSDPDGSHVSSDEGVPTGDAHFEALFGHGLNGILLTTDRGVVLRANEEARRLFQRDEGTFRGVVWRELVASEDPRVEAARQRCFDSGKFAGVITMVRRDNTRFQAEVSVTQFRDAQGRGLVYIFVRDITERLRSEQALLASEHRYRSLIETTGNVLIGIAPHGMIFEWNREAQHVFGYSRREVLGRNYFELLVPEPARDAAAADLRRGLAGETVRHTEHVVRGSDGIDRIVLWNFTSLVDASGHAIGVIASGQDITERSLAERASRQQREILETILDHIPMMVAFIDARGSVRWANANLVNTLGWPVHEIASIDLLEALLPSTEARDAARRHMLDSHGHWRDFTVQTRDGRELIVAWASVALSDGTHIAIGRDVTFYRRAQEERKRLEGRMQHAQKLESLGVLAGGIAHDFNNLLVGILGNASLALMDIPTESPLHEVVKDIETTALRAADLTKQMLAYSGRGRFIVRPLELSGLVEEMAHLLQTVISKRATLHLDLARELPLVEGDATQVRQVVMNLITNASDALDGLDGEIVVTTGLTDCDGAAPRTEFSDMAPDPGPYVFVEVRDTGHGMPEETLARIFEPFFSTKFTGRGLGLAATLGIVRGHRGTIRVESTPGAGTIFRVLFPVMAVESANEPADEVTGAAPGSGAVLVVDDDATVRSVAGHMLTRRGYDVLTAVDGVDALEVFTRERERLSLVFVDLTMPRMGGEEVIRKMKRLDPAVRVILMSGFSEQELARKVTEEHIVAFIQKPFRIEELDRVLRRAAGVATPAGVASVP